jgi:hypothetical protein
MNNPVKNVPHRMCLLRQFPQARERPATPTMCRKPLHDQQGLMIDDYVPQAQMEVVA